MHSEEDTMYKMTVAELIEKLQGFSPDDEVRLAQQPSWPFEYSIGEVVQVQTGMPDEGERVVWEDNDGEHEGGFVEALTNGTIDVRLGDDDDFRTVNVKLSDVTNIDEPVNIVYIGEGTQLAYLGSAAADELGWGRR
jgi:hypothetical protein